MEIAWKIIAIVFLVIGLIVIGIIVTKGVKGADLIIQGFVRKVRYTFCCNVLGCLPWYQVGWSKLNPLCSIACWGCACGETC